VIAASLFGVFALAKMLILAGRDIPVSLWAPAAYLWQDLLVALVFAAIDRGLRRPSVAWSAYAIIVLYTAINVPVTRVLSTPLTWPVLRAAGAPLADSIAYHLRWENLAPIFLVLFAGALFPLLVRSFPQRIFALSAVVALICVPFGVSASRRIETLGLDRNVLAVLVTTAVPRVEARPLVAEWRASPGGIMESEDLTSYRGAAAGRNVVLVILESAGARYLRSYGAVEDPMPHLTRLAREAVLFENAYAVYPESIKGLFSVLCSVYPAVDTEPRTYEGPNYPSIASVLAGAGYRTALFHSGRFMYLGMNSIIRNRGFHTLEDAGDIGGEHDSSFGIDEPSAVRRILAWIDATPADQPFFVAYLPIAGHHPYESSGERPFPEHDEAGRYRNALFDADAALGTLLEGLAQRRRDRNTLFVIFGDHGEAFGQHQGNYGHTFLVYDENVRVPLILAVPGVCEARRVSRVASLIDLAPTILDLLGLPPPASYQGQSLLDGRERMALFFTDYSLGFLGLRDREWKFIYQLGAGRTKLFDLGLDPEERNDLSARSPERIDPYTQRLLGWSAAQRELILRNKYR
jgi:phosphoglycerol transferase MdoB-like AlkP superfamily enzyme